jgi:hypothetical protein
VDKATTHVALAKLLAVIDGASLLTEGQLVNITGIDRVAVRKLVDEGRDIIQDNPLSGVNGAAIMHEMGL